jgi:hypothetical protein
MTSPSHPFRRLIRFDNQHFNQPPYALEHAATAYKTLHCAPSRPARTLGTAVDAVRVAGNAEHLLQRYMLL